MARRGMKRRTFWLADELNYATLTNNATTSIEVLTASGIHAAAAEPTVVRMVGSLTCSFQRPSPFEDSIVVDYFLGIRCVDGAAATQSPRTELDADDWMWTGYQRDWATFTQFPVWNGSAIVTNRGNQHGPIQRLDFDIRSMRKAPDRCSLRLEVATNVVQGAAPSSHHISGYIRALLKE